MCYLASSSVNGQQLHDRPPLDDSTPLLLIVVVVIVIVFKVIFKVVVVFKVIVDCASLFWSIQ
jgi:hypothetical protein